MSRLIIWKGVIWIILLSKFSQNLLIVREIMTNSTRIGCFMISRKGIYIAISVGVLSYDLTKAMREAC